MVMVTVSSQAYLVLELNQLYKAVHSLQMDVFQLVLITLAYSATVS